MTANLPDPNALPERDQGAPGVSRRVILAGLLTAYTASLIPRVLAYEQALNAQVVSDVLMPPSYCHGGYGHWANKAT